MSRRTRSHHHRSVLARLILAVLAVPLVTATFLLASAGPASAATTSAGQQLFCQTGGTTSNNTSSQNDLPMVRWSNAVAAQHSDLSIGLFDLSQIPDVVARDGVVSSLNGVSQSEWTLSTDLVELSQRFCVADSVGYQTDNIVGRLWRGISRGSKGPVLLTALALVVIVSTLWSLSRGKPKPWARAAKFAVVLGVLVVMGTGAAASTDNGGSYQPGLLSPGWVVTHTFGVISNVGNSLGAAFAQINQQPLTVPSTVVASDPLTCNQYTSQLVADYQASYSNTSLSYAVPESLNGLWMQSTIPTFVDEQFGMDNNFGPLVYCHLLEDTSNIPPSTQMRIALAASPALAHTSPRTIPSALAWTATSNQEVDESVIGWAACQSPNANFVPSEWNLANGTQIYPSEWAVVKNPDNGNNMTVQQSNCWQWWGSPATGSTCGVCSGVTAGSAGSTALDPNKSPFYWPDDPSGIQSAANAAGSQQLSDGQGPVGAGLDNFLSNFHGTTSTSAVITAYIYLASSTGVAVVFMILALAILLAKLALLVSMLLMIFVVLAALMPGGSPDKLVSFGKHLLGLILFVTCGSLLVSAIAVLTSLIVAAGTGVVGQYNIMSIIWVGLAPLGAIILIHHFFKKVLKAPSPFKPSSALAYSAAAGGFAGGLGGSALMDRVKDRGMQGIKSAASRGYNKAGTASSPGQPNRRTGGMDPTQTPGGQSGGGQNSGRTGGQGGQNGSQPIQRPETIAEATARERSERAQTPGERAAARHGLAEATRKSDKAEKAAAKQTRLESYQRQGYEAPRVAIAHDRLKDAARSHYYNWRTNGGPKRAAKRIALGAAAVALGAPGGAAVAAYAYHRHRARRRAGAPGSIQEFRRSGQQRRQEALDSLRQSQRRAVADRDTPAPPGNNPFDANNPADHAPSDPFGDEPPRPASSSPRPGPGNAGAERRIDPAPHGSHGPAGPEPRPARPARVDNRPDGEWVGDRHIPNQPPEPTPPEVYEDRGE